MKVAEACALAEHLMSEHRLIGWKFQVRHIVDEDGTELHCSGQCDYEARMITADTMVTRANTRAVVTDTILHEIAHALTDPNAEAHGEEWKRMCVEVGARPEEVERLGVWKSDIAEALAAPKVAYNGPDIVGRTFVPRNHWTHDRAKVENYIRFCRELEGLES
jgi:putative aminopeptidase FrvX